MMANTGAALPAATLRRDPWWLEILPTIARRGGFTLYALYVIFVNNHYYAEPYLSPFYSPCLAAQCQHLTLPLVGRWWPLSPALLILWAPLGFRATCYYYRKAYYRAFFLDPPACAVGESRPHKYRGETAFPLILQNLHRYFLYAALIFLIILWYDAIRAFWFDGRFGIGAGSLVLSTNIILLTLYTFSCHSLRHIAGGNVDCFSCVSFGGPRRTT